jgi:hypothetical protein
MPEPNEVVIPENIKGNSELEAAYRAAGNSFRDENTGTPPADQPPPPSSPATTPAPSGSSKPPETGAFDFKKFGESFTSPDEVLASFQKAQEDNKVLRESLESIKSIKERSMIDDPVLFRLNSIKKNSPDKFSLHLKLATEPDTLRPFDLLKLQFLRDNPEFKDKTQEVDDYINAKYGFDDKEIPELTAEEITEMDDAEEVVRRQKEISDHNRSVRNKRMEVQIEASKIKKTLTDEFDSIPAPISLKDPEHLQKEIQRAEAEWSGITQKMLQNFNKVSVLVQGKDDKEPKTFMTYDVPDDFKKDIGTHIVKFIVENELRPTEETVNLVGNLITARFSMAYQAKVNHALMTKVRSITEEEWMKITHNPHVSQTPELPEGGIEENLHDKSLNEVLKAEGFPIK